MPDAPQLQGYRGSCQHQPPISTTEELHTVSCLLGLAWDFPALILFGWCNRNRINDCLPLISISLTSPCFLCTPLPTPLVNLVAFLTSPYLSRFFFSRFFSFFFTYPCTLPSLTLLSHRRSIRLTHPWLMRGRVRMGGGEKRRAGVRIWLMSHMTWD